jgi:hypothetical protein
MSRILIADDQNDVLEALRICSRERGHQTDAGTRLRKRTAYGCFSVKGPTRTMEFP